MRTQKRMEIEDEYIYFDRHITFIFKPAIHEEISLP
ncbi:hypothetical protein NIES22_22160 [Calothrix brevissima NIES-22]|nr:hypothetical protein NIES22_22160 [Calothrix brevissima NIES-22]